jgi:hypothetical protein
MQYLLIIPFILGAAITAIEMNRIVQGNGASGWFWPTLGGFFMGSAFIVAVVL